MRVAGSLQGRSIRVLVVAAEGSAPREAGASMLVRHDGFDGTIGGGALELAALSKAREILGHDASPPWQRELVTVPLGPALGQCCGGIVRLLFEVVPASYAQIDETSAVQTGLVVRDLASLAAPAVVTNRAVKADWPLPVLRAARAMLSGERPRQTLLIAASKSGHGFVIEPQARPPQALYLYGAGHVGRAVVRALRDLPFAITWVDVAADRFPPSIESLPAHGDRPSAAGGPTLRCRISTDPAAVAASAPPETAHLIMTFSHALDLAITAAVLARPFAWAGLIGSATKRARFDKRLGEGGIAAGAISRLNCPIGMGGISGKEPAMIAISVAAQLAAWSCQRELGRTEQTPDSDYGRAR